MNELLQTVAVAIILIVAVVYVIRRIRRPSGGGCGCGEESDACSSATDSCSACPLHDNCGSASWRGGFQPPAPARIGKGIFASAPFWLFIGYCGIISAMWIYSRPLIGDDLFYVSDLNDRGGGLKALPRLMGAIFFGCNGRWADLLNTVWLTLLPRAVTAVAAFLFTVLLPWAAVKLSGLRFRQIIPVTLLTMATVWLLPWYDMTHLVCLINYPWGASAVLVCLLPLCGNFEMRSRWWIAALPVAFVSAGWHEASGVPLVVGLFCWCILNGKWRRFTMIKKWWFASMIVGGLFTVSSPAIWNRVASTDAAQADYLGLLFGSAYISAILFIVLLIILLFKRDLFQKLLSDTFVIFAVASLVSACIVMVGGIPGRSGFYAQIFGAIALMRIAVAGRFIPEVRGAVPTIAAILLYAASAWYVTRVYDRDLTVTLILQVATAVYPQNHDEAYRLILSVPYFEEWDAASLKTYDPRYDPRLDHTPSLRLHGEE